MKSLPMKTYFKIKMVLLSLNHSRQTNVTFELFRTDIRYCLHTLGIVRVRVAAKL